MITKNRQKLHENISHCQSTPAPSKSHLSIKDSFGRSMPLTNPPSPVTSNEVDKPDNKNKVKKPSMVEMICKAIESLGNGRKGASVPAIKKWIVGNYVFESEGVVNVRIRKGLQKGLENGIIDRSVKSAQITGAKGFFIIKAKPKQDKAKSSKAKKIGPQKNKGKPNYASDSEVTFIKSNKRKSSKMHASDTDLPPETDEQLKPKKKSELKKSRKPNKTEVPKKGQQKIEKGKTKSKPVKPNSASAKTKEKKTDGEAKTKKEKEKQTKKVMKPKKAAEGESSGKKVTKK